MTQDSFFDKANIVASFASLLGIDASKIRKVEIIRDTGAKKRRAADSLVYIALTIFEDPIATITNENAFDTVNTTLKNLTATIVNRFTTGELQSSAKQLFNVDIQGLFIHKPNSNGTDAKISEINKIKIIQEADGCKEQSPCTQQPILMVLDKDVSLILI